MSNSIAYQAQETMTKILFPTDFSDASTNAFIYALKLAENLDAEIITLHIYEPPKLGYSAVPGALNEIYDLVELDNFENYKDQVPYLRHIAEQNNLQHIKMRNVLDRGSLIRKILKISKEESIDYIVMGTKGATSLKETFLGTATTRVMDESKTIVFAIPEKCEFQQIDKILFLTRYKSKDLSVLRRVQQFAKIFNAHIDCLYVNPGHQEHLNKLDQEWLQLSNQNNMTLHEIKNSDIEGIILEFIALNEINLITMHVRHESFFNKLFQVSLSKKLAFHVKIPILAIPG